MQVATVDLDDTLMRTGHDYDDAKRRFGQFMEREYDVPAEDAVKTVESIDRDQLDHLGLSMERFPSSFKAAVEELATNPPEEHKEHADELARTAYKTRQQYAKRGYMDGAKEMISLLQSVADEVHLITAGVPELQQRKIEALRLNESFDSCHVVEMDTKCQTLEQIHSNAGTHKNGIYHIGNSERSDVQAALRAGVNAVHLPLNQWRGNSGSDYEANNSVAVYDTHKEFNTALRSGL